MTDTARPTHVVRVLRMREMLDAKSYLTVSELMETFNISRRTVYNDLSALMEAGVPVYSEVSPEGEARWQLMPAARKQTLTLSIGQVFSLGLAHRALSFLDGTDLYGELTTVIDRLGLGLSPRYRAFLALLQRKFAVVDVGPKSYRDKADVLDDVLTALLYDERLELAYRPPGERVRTHLVEPYTLLLHAEALYLIAYSQTRKERRTFAVDRIARSRRLKGDRFDYPADYDPAAALDGSFGIVGGKPEPIEILFAKEAAPYIRERVWHSTQTLTTLADGRLRLKMIASGAREILAWLFGRAENVEVLAPPSLRAQARELLRKAAERHATANDKDDQS